MTDDKTIAPAPDGAALPAVRTFASVLDAAKIPARLKRELLALYHADLHRTRDEAEAACTPEALVTAAREGARAAGELGYYEGVRDHAYEVQKFSGETYDAATAARAAAMRRFRDGPGIIAHATISAGTEGIEAAKARATLPEDHPQRRALCGPQPGAALAYRARIEAAESAAGGVTVRHEGDE